LIFKASIFCVVSGLFPRAMPGVFVFEAKMVKWKYGI